MAGIAIVTNVQIWQKPYWALVSENGKSSTTKDTKEHKGLRGPWWSSWLPFRGGGLAERTVNGRAG